MIEQFRRTLRSHRSLLWLCAVIAVNQLGFGIIVPVVPLYAQSFGVSTAAIGLAVAVYGLGRLLFDLPMGQLAERYGRRTVLLLGGGLTAGGSLLCGFATTYEQLILFRFIAGIGAATVLTGGQVYLADISTPENRGRMTSVYMGFFIFAVGFGPTPGGIIADLFGMRAPFFAFAILGTLAGVIATTRLPETRGRSTGSQTAREPSPPFGETLRMLLRRPGFVLVGAIAFAQFFARTGAIFSVVPLLGANRLGLSASQIGVAFTIANVLNLALVSFSGLLVDRFGRKAVIVPGSLLSGLAFVAFTGADTYPLFVASTVLWGLAGGISSAAPTAYAADMAPRGANGVTMGVYRTLADAGYVVGPATLGLLADQYGPDTALIGTAALIVFVTVPFALYAPETMRRPGGVPRPVG
ncbi:MAG: MFS transporter [Chloroflexi bacterium]|nr:MFS transporter [Chloroflexota bacterium]